MDPYYEDRLNNSVSQLKSLKDKMSECENAIGEINSFTDMALLLQKTKQFSQDIDKRCRNTVEAIENDWLSITDDLSRRIEGKFKIIETQIEAQYAELGLDQFIEAGRLASNLVLECLRTFYRLAIYQTILALEEEKLLSKSDLKELGLSAAEWVKTIALDFVPMSGTLLKIFNLVSDHLSGEEIEESLWNSWTDNIKLERSCDLLRKANRKALMVIRFSEYHLSSLINVLHFENVVTEGPKNGR